MDTVFEIASTNPASRGSAFAAACACPAAANVRAVCAADATATGVLTGNTVAHNAETPAWITAGAAANGIGSGGLRPGCHGAYWPAAILLIRPYGVRTEISPSATTTAPTSCGSGLTTTVKSAPPGRRMLIIEFPAMMCTPSRLAAPMRPVTKRISPFINSTVEPLCLRLPSR